MMSCTEGVETVSPAGMETPSDNVKLITSLYEANLVLVDYLELHDSDRYVLGVTQEEAEKLGVPKEFYDAIIANLESTNEAIQAAKIRVANDPENCSLELTDPQVERRIQAETRLQPQPRSGPHPNNPIQGSFNTSGQEEARHFFKLSPMWLKGVRFYCMVKVMTGGITCKTYSFGVWMEKTTVGFFNMNKIVEVGAVAANTTLTVTFATGSPFGARVSYEGMGWVEGR